MVDTKTSDKLDALLRMYYNSATTQGEKNNAKTLFERICKKHDIDPDTYRNNSRANPANENTRTSGSRRNNSSSSSNSGGMDFNDFWETVMRGFGGAYKHRPDSDANSYRQQTYNREKQEEAQRKADEAKRRDDYRRRTEEARRRDEERQRAEEQARREYNERRYGSWSNNKWGTFEFEIKEVLWEVKYHNQKRVIFLNTMSRGKGTKNKWGTQNYVIYSETFDPEQWFTLKPNGSNEQERIFVIETGKVTYFRDHYVIQKLSIIDSAGFEVDIPIQ
jgi:hypothetical protein